MSYTHEDNLKTALAIFRELLIKKSIHKDDHADLIVQYHSQPEVADILRNQVAEVFEVHIIATPHSIHMAPNSTASPLAMSRADRREAMKLRNNEELYLSDFIFLTYISLLFDSEDTLTPRTYVSLDELVTTVDQVINAMSRQDADNLKSDESRIEMNLRGMIECWTSKHLSNVLKSTDSEFQGKSLNYRRDFAYWTMRFWEKAGYVRVDNPSHDIYPDPSLTLSHQRFFGTNARVERVLGYIGEWISREAA